MSNLIRTMARYKRAASAAWRPAAAAMGSAWAAYALLGALGAMLIAPALLWLALSISSAKVPPSSPRRRRAATAFCAAAGMIAPFYGPAWLAGFALAALGLSIDLGYAALPKKADFILLAGAGLAAFDSFSGLSGNGAAAANVLCAVGFGCGALAFARQSFKIDPLLALSAALSGLGAYALAGAESNLLFSAFGAALFNIFWAVGFKQLAAQLKNGSSNAASQSFLGVKASAGKIVQAAEPTPQEASQAESEILAKALDGKPRETNKVAPPASRKSL